MDKIEYCGIVIILILSLALIWLNPHQLVCNIIFTVMWISMLCTRAWATKVFRREPTVGFHVVSYFIHMSLIYLGYFLWMN